MKLPDPRSAGSGNPGATNVLRVGGKTAAAITLAGDALKGFIPVFVASILGVTPLILNTHYLARCEFDFSNVFSSGTCQLVTDASLSMDHHKINTAGNLWCSTHRPGLHKAQNQHRPNYER